MYLLFIILLTLWTADVNGQRLRIEGRVYEHGQPMELGATNCEQLDSSQCKMVQESVCTNLISLVPDMLSKSVSCANYQIRKDEEKYFRMVVDLQFQPNTEAMRNINVTCATFTSLYLLDLRASVRENWKTLGDPVSIEPHPYEYDWDSDKVDFSVQGTLLVNGAKVPYEQKDTVNLTEVQAKLYIAPGRQRMILPIYSRAQFELMNPTLLNQNGFVGLSFLITYEKSMITAYRLDPSCNTFATLLQEGFRTTHSGALYQMGPDTRVNLLTRMDQEEENAGKEDTDFGSEPTFPDEASTIEDSTLGEDYTSVEDPTNEELNEVPDVTDAPDNGSGLAQLSLFTSLALVLFNVALHP